MSCNHHVRQALLKTAAKKRFENILLMKEQFRMYLQPEEEEDYTDYCWCGEDFDGPYCDHCESCEDWAEGRYNYCPYCGVEL